MGWFDWLWYTKSLEDRIDEYEYESRKLREQYGKTFKETYPKANKAVDLTGRLATLDDDPKAQLKTLESMLDLASEFTGDVPLMSEYLTLLKNGCSAGIQGLEHIEEYYYKRYKQIRDEMDNLSKGHRKLLRKSLPVSEAMIRRMEKRYQFEQLRERADELEVRQQSCDTCSQTRSADKLYACSRCDNEVCNYCIYPCNEGGDYVCPECRDECTHDGSQYCLDHLQECSVDGKLYCQDYISACDIGGAVTCLAHLTDCNGCGNRLCDDHEEICDSCELLYGPDCIRTCRGCGDPFCDSCFDPAIEQEELAA